MVHELKILPEYFEAVVSGDKTFEVRRKDRRFKVGQYLKLFEWFDLNYTGRTVKVKITYILDNKDYCANNTVIMGIKLVEV